MFIFCFVLRIRNLFCSSICFVLLEICFCISGRRRSERSHGSAGSLRLYRQREPGQPGMVRLG
jgi:hypothetical protein